MLRNFAQIVRSGVVGRKSFGTRPKKLIQHWLNTATETQLLNASIGNNPSLADVVKMVHPQPREAWRAAWFAWLIGKPYEYAALLPLTAAFETYKRNKSKPRGALPPVPLQMLPALNLDGDAWAAHGSKCGRTSTPSRATAFLIKTNTTKTDTSVASPPNYATRLPSPVPAPCRTNC